MKILALDLGTYTGWALWKDGEISSGAWELMSEAEVKNMRAADLDRCCDPRFGRLVRRLQDLGPVDSVFFEDVQFLSSQLQAQLWAGLRTVVLLLQPLVNVHAVPVGTLKKFATGKGNAQKEDMLAALVAKFPDRFEASTTPRGRAIVVRKGTKIEVGDDEADALHLLVLAIEQLGLK